MRPAKKRFMTGKNFCLKVLKMEQLFLAQISPRLPYRDGIGNL